MDSLWVLTTLLLAIPYAHADCCFASECPFQVSDTQFVFAKCPGCNCADELGNCLAGCEATNCGCDGCRGAEAACGTEGGCGTCGNIQGHCDMSYMQGCANKPKIQPGRFLRAGGGSGGAAGTSGGRKNSNRTRISPSPAPKIYPTVASYSRGVATGYVTPRKPYNGYNYSANTTAFIQPGFTPVGFPGQGLPAGFRGTPSVPLVYDYHTYYTFIVYGSYNYTPSDKGPLMRYTNLQLYYWLGLGRLVTQPNFPGLNYLESLPDADLAMLMGNGTQSCQKVMLWRYRAASLINALQIGVYFDCIDKDEDGYIDPWEFCMEYGCYGEPGNRFANFDAALQTFGVSDTDDDGVVSPQEFDPKLKDSSVTSQTSGR